jgi:hypothetical protein
MFKAQVLHVDSQVPDIGEQRRQLARAVIDDNQNLRKGCVSAVFAGKSTDSVIAGCEKFRENGGGGVTVQRIEYDTESAVDTLEYPRDIGRVCRKNLNPQVRIACGDSSEIAETATRQFHG